MTDGNWIYEFARAIDIYTGKIKGFKDVPEEQLMRQELMKADLKLYIRTIISEQLDLMNGRGIVEAPVMEISDKMEKYRTLFTIAIEFCITISDWYFLFYDLFILFEEE